MSLYHYPKIYAALLKPEEDMLADVPKWIEEHLEGELKAICDPACGPATWLIPFAQEGYFVGGNDIEPKMLEEASHLLKNYPHELVLGDMRHLTCQHQYDVALNFDASIGHLSTDEDVIQHLRSVWRMLRMGGLYFVGLFVLDADKIDQTVEELFEATLDDIDQKGFAHVRYQSLYRDPIHRRERIRLELKTHGLDDVPEFLEEEYDLFTFSKKDLLKVIAAAGGWEIAAVHSMEFKDNPAIELEENCGDILLILRKIPII